MNFSAKQIGTRGLKSAREKCRQKNSRILYILESGLLEAPGTGRRYLCLSPLGIFPSIISFWLDSSVLDRHILQEEGASSVLAREITVVETHSSRNFRSSFVGRKSHELVSEVYVRAENKVEQSEARMQSSNSDVHCKKCRP